MHVVASGVLYGLLVILAVRLIFFYIMLRLLRGPALFPYTTLFRSCLAGALLSIRTRRRRLRLRRIFSSAMFADRKSTRLNSSHGYISYAVFCSKKKPPRADDKCALQHEKPAPPASCLRAADRPRPV